MKKHHYVYYSYEEWGRGYIGCRSCDCLPEEDTKYFGSFYDKTFKPTEKTILFTGETRQEVMEIEIELHDFFDVAVNPQFANRSKQTSTRFDVTGVPWTEEQKKARSGENHPMYGRTGENHPRFGVSHTEAQNKAQSERMVGKYVGENHPLFGVPNSEAQKKAQSERMSGEKNHRFGVAPTEETRKKQSVAMSGENNPMFGAPRTEEVKNKISEALSGEKHPQFGRIGALCFNSKAITAIKPDGTELHFVSGAETAKELGIDLSVMRISIDTGNSLKRGKFKGWRFTYKNPTNF